MVVPGLSGHARSVGIHERVRRHYETVDEDDRLWTPGIGDLVRLRTWDIFDRYLPGQGRLLDVGGGPGTHAERLARLGYRVTLIDPMPAHVERALRRSGGRFGVQLGEARHLPAGDGTLDVVVLMGPLYHLVTAEDRLVALREARPVLRPGGVLLAEVITRHAWVIDATVKGLLGDPAVWATFDENLRTGLSQHPDRVTDGVFWAYFHRPEELRAELVEAGFDDVRLVAVEGFACLLGDLEARMEQPEPLLRVIRLTETDRSMLGCSPHVIGVATRR